MYADFMKKKIVNIWGQNFTEILQKNCPEKNTSLLKCIEKKQKKASSEKKLISKKTDEQRRSF